MDDPEEGHTPAYMVLAQTKFALSLRENRENVELKGQLLAGIIEGNMAPFYIKVCADFGWDVDQTLLDTMIEANNESLKQFEKEVIPDTSTLDDDYDSRVWYEKLIFLCSIGDERAAKDLAACKLKDKHLSVNRRLDVLFTLYRISFFHGCDLNGMKSAIDKATAIVEGKDSGDWSARNKLKCYQAICCLGFREYERAANLFLDSLPTFTSYELVTFGDFVRYAVLTAMVSLPRNILHENLTKQGVVPQALHSELPILQEYFSSLYDCSYAKFFLCLAEIETMMKYDPLTNPHVRQYVREMRIRAYSQMLEAYSSLSLQRMAEAFGVSEEFIEKEIARFTAAGRLYCKIDEVAGTVITGKYLQGSVDGASVPFSTARRREMEYQSTIKCGDSLLNRLKKLTKVMDF